MIEQSPLLSSKDQFQLADVVARYSLLPHPDVIARIPKAVFPTRRVSNYRYTLSECRTFVGDDNVSPRWALLWAHGYKRQTVASGWQVAHVWDDVKSIASFTALANLAFVPKPLTRLTDSGGPALPFLKWHCWSKYGWKPDNSDKPEKPLDFDKLNWVYLPDCDDPSSNIDERSKSNNKLMRAIRKMRGST